MVPGQGAEAECKGMMLKRERQQQQQQEYQQQQQQQQGEGRPQSAALPSTRTPGRWWSTHGARQWASLPSRCTTEVCLCPTSR